MISQTIHDVLELHVGSPACPANVVDAFARLCHPRQVKAGEILFREGDASDHVSILVAGQIDLLMHVPGRGDARLLSLGPGDLLGWSPLVGSGRMTATAVAMQDSELLCADGPAIKAACMKDHEFGCFIMQYVAAAVARRLLNTRLQLLDLYSLSTSASEPPQFITMPEQQN